jgi:hypothetical protein
MRRKQDKSTDTESDNDKFHDVLLMIEDAMVAGLYDGKANWAQDFRGLRDWSHYRTLQQTFAACRRDAFAGEPQVFEHALSR